MKLYSTLSKWYRLLTPLEHYQEEAEEIKNIILTHNPKAKTIIELGCGAGHNAFYLKNNFSMVLSDISDDMLNLSREINPECRHIKRDMKEINLPSETFDVVFIHDAASYLTSIEEVYLTIEKAKALCREDSILIVCPDYLKETFKPDTSCGGSDKGNKGMRYLEWVEKNKDNENNYTTDFAFIFKENGKVVSIEQETHIMGLFGIKEWLDIFATHGFSGNYQEIKLSDEKMNLLLGIKT